MLLSALAEIICIKGSASENMRITVKSHTSGVILYRGIAKDLKKFTKYNRSWMVVEVRIDHDDNSNYYDYNRGKIITVI